MRDYSKVSPRFWTGSTGRELRKLGSQAQVIAFYLFTCPSANMLGLYYLGMPTLCHETGSPLKGALKGLQDLREAQFAYYDRPSEHVYVPNMAREQIGERLQRKDNRHVAVLKELRQLKNTVFYGDFVIRYREAFELHDLELDPNFVSPLQAPSKPLRSQEQEQEQEQNQEQEQEGSAEGSGTSRAKRSTATRIPEGFELTGPRMDIAVAEGVDPVRTIAKFIDYWKSLSGAKACKLDWDATWRNWCRSEADRASRNGSPHKTRFAQAQEALDRA